MRLFVAIELSEELKRSITGMLHDLKKLGVKGSYVPMQNLHLTLAFIGETKETDAVKAALETVTFKPFKLSLAEPGCFGNLLYAGIKGSQGLSAAVKSVREAFDLAGIEYDKKDFTPHITLLRNMSGNWKKAAVPKAQMMVKKISLMKSSVRDGKRIYTEIFSI